LIDEVDRQLGLRKKFANLRGDTVKSLGSLYAQRPSRRLNLEQTLRMDELSDGLGALQAQLSASYRAKRKLPRQCHSALSLCKKELQNGLQKKATAVQLQLNDLFARKRLAFRKIDAQPVIDYRRRLRIDDFNTA